MKNENKFPGLIIDDKLSWKSHAKHVNYKISKLIILLYRVSDCFILAALKTLYFNFIHTHFLFGIIFWGSAAKRDFESIYIDCTKSSEKTIEISKLCSY